MKANDYKAKTADAKTCSGCWNSFFRKKNGVLVLYCGYHNITVLQEGGCSAYKKFKNP